MSATSRRESSSFFRDLIRGLSRSDRSFQEPAPRPPLPEGLVGTASGSTSSRPEINVKPSFWSDFLGGLTKSGPAFRDKSDAATEADS